MYHKSKEEAVAGDMIGVNLSGVDYKLLKRGFVIGDAENNPPLPVESFTAQIIIMWHPNGIKIGYTPTMFCHTASFPCEII